MRVFDILLKYFFCSNLLTPEITNKIKAFRNARDFIHY